MSCGKTQRGIGVKTHPSEKRRQEAVVGIGGAPSVRLPKPQSRPSLETRYFEWIISLEKKAVEALE